VEKDVKVPIAFNILGRWVDVKYSKTLESDGFDLFGAMSPLSKKMQIVTDMPDLQTLETYLHEYTHGLFFYSAQDENFTTRQMEIVCTLVENFAEIVYLRPKCEKIKYKTLTT